MRLSGAVSSFDVTDRAGRLVGVVSPSGTFATDPIDRLARVLGQVNALLGTGLLNQAWAGSDQVVNPGANTIIATTGALANAGLYLITFMLSINTVDPAYMLQWRSSVPAVKGRGRVFENTAAPGRFFGWTLIPIVANDDVVLITTSALTANLSGFISAVRLS